MFEGDKLSEYQTNIVNTKKIFQEHFKNLLFDQIHETCPKAKSVMRFYLILARIYTNNLVKSEMLAKGG